MVVWWSRFLQEEGEFAFLFRLLRRSAESSHAHSEGLGPCRRVEAAGVMNGEAKKMPARPINTHNSNRQGV